MRKIFMVTREMCGGDFLPGDFDLEAFCDSLQGKLSDVEVVPADAVVGLSNLDGDLVSAELIREALGECYPK